MTGDFVVAIVAALRDLDIWIAGGWGIDALVGRQTRDHDDLDLVHRAEHETALLETLTEMGFVQTVDWRPVRFVVTDPDGHEIDLHPLNFSADGSAVQASLDPQQPFVYPASCFVTGTVHGVEVPCVSVEQQIYFHSGYEPADRDRHDMAQLRMKFGVATHF